jgi:hypothetical protein
VVPVVSTAFASFDLDEFGDNGPMPPAEVQQVRAMLPHITVG